MRAAVALVLLSLSIPAYADSPLAGRVIALDPGHGVIDFEGNIINSGKASSDGTTPEHQVVFEISRRLKRLLEDEGAKVILTRTEADYWRQAYTIADDNKARALLANELKADVYISIHCDWHPRQNNHGVTTYYKTPESLRLGENIHRNLIQELKAENRYLRKDSFTVLDQVSMPAVLVETGFLSNRAEAKKLSSPSYQARVARAMAEGLRGYFAN